MKIAIVGAGVAGLTTALLLKDSAHQVTVYERAEELTEVGAGIQLGPNAVRVLEAGGLREGMRDRCVPTTALEGREWDTGRKVFDMRYEEAEAARFGAPYYLCHRAVLQNLLREAVGDDDIKLGKELVKIDQDDAEARLAFADGSIVTADLIVGADGIRSLVRDAVGMRTEPVYAGMSAYRGNIPAHETRDAELEREMVKWWGPTPTHHMVMYRLGDGSINFVGVVPEESWTSDSWITPADPHDLRRRFHGFADPVGPLLNSVSTIYRWALYDRDVEPGWSAGRVVLVGDSCHAMLPFLAQGAAQAIESAAVLARCLTELAGTDLGRALTTYEATRFPRVSRVNSTSRAHGLLSSTTDPGFVNWLYEFDATTTPLAEV
jgi:salicylate hydroxylase/6-hydroxynicotinate 3-monooxygenase